MFSVYEQFEKCAHNKTRIHQNVRVDAQPCVWWRCTYAGSSDHELGFAAGVGLDLEGVAGVALQGLDLLGAAELHTTANAAAGHRPARFGVCEFWRVPVSRTV